VKLKLQSGDRQLIFAVIIWLTVSALSFYYRFNLEFHGFTILNWVILPIVHFAIVGGYLVFSLFVWLLLLDIVLRIAGSGNNGGVHNLFEEKRNWTIKELVFHFLFGLPIGGAVLFAVLSLFDLI
jgi:hypothetical protein